MQWDEDREAAFKGLKALLVSLLVLHIYIVECDTRERGMVVVVSQFGDEHKKHPILYASRKLTEREKAYSASEKDCACLVCSAEKLSRYLNRERILFATDSCPLT